MSEKSFPLMNITLWKDVTMAGDNKVTRIEANWYDDEGALEDLIDIRVVQHPSITEKGLFVSCRGWQELCVEVDSLIDEMKKKVARLTG